MEKIYMEDNNNRKNKRKFDISVPLSFLVAIFAIFSILAAGFDTMGNHVSYAAPDSLVGDNIQFTVDDTRFIQGWGVASNNADIMTFGVPSYFADQAMTIPAYCVEHTVDAQSAQYSKGDVIDDYGLLFLLDSRSALASEVNNQYAQTWIMQVAIWMYLYETDPTATDPSSKNYISADDLENISATRKLTVNSSEVFTGDGTSLYDKYVKPLVNAAKEVSASKNLSVTKESDDLSKTSDGKYYQTSLITVSGIPAVDFESYDVNLSGVDGAFIVNENGEVMENTNIVDDKFYVRIPVENIKEAKQNLNVSVTGHFDTLTGNYYTATDGSPLQKVITVTGTTKDIMAGVDFEIVGSPDTGMSTSQTIYFIGLIVLLCGIGIVYANAKQPIGSKK